MSEKTFMRVLIGYFICATLVFGYSYNADYEPEISLFDKGRNGFRATFCAIFWPGYLSLKAFEGVRK